MAFEIRCLDVQLVIAVRGPFALYLKLAAGPVDGSAVGIQVGFKAAADSEAGGTAKEGPLLARADRVVSGPVDVPDNGAIGDKAGLLAIR